MKKLRAFFANEEGATAIEYGLIAAAIALVIAPLIGAIGLQLNTVFTNLSAAMGP